MADHWITVRSMRALAAICEEASLPASLFSAAIQRDLCERGKVARIEGDRILPEDHAHRLAENWRAVEKGMEEVEASTDG